jgi:hypothetical protein
MSAIAPNSPKMLVWIRPLGVVDGVRHVQPMGVLVALKAGQTVVGLVALVTTLRLIEANQVEEVSLGVPPQPDRLGHATCEGRREIALAGRHEHHVVRRLEASLLGELSIGELPLGLLLDVVIAQKGPKIEVIENFDFAGDSHPSSLALVPLERY